MSKWHRIPDMHTHESFRWRVGMVSTVGIVIRVGKYTSKVLDDGEIESVLTEDMVLADHRSNEAFLCQLLIELYPRGRVHIDTEYSCVQILHQGVAYAWYFGDHKGSLLNALCIAAFEDRRKETT